MNTKNIILNVLLILIFCTGCEKNFEEINSKSYAPKEVSPGALLPTIISGFSARMAWASFEENNELMQYTASNNTIKEVQWYLINDSESSNAWSIYAFLQNTMDMYRIAEKNNDKNYMAIALTLKSLMFSYLTDTFIEVPYEEGLSAEEGILQPKFDSQEKIYHGILSDLERANSLVNLEEDLPPSEDILYNGDMMKWKKFINSLRIRYYMRLSKRKEIDSGKKINEILLEPEKYPIFESNEDAAIVKYTGVQPFVNALSFAGEYNFSMHSMCSTLIDLLKRTNDSRIAIYSEPIKDSNGEEGLIYDGVPSGLPLSEISGANPTKSFLNLRFSAPDMKQLIMPYCELQFLLAEAAQKNMIGLADAEGYYIAGITASFNFWNQPVPEGFLEQPEIKFNNSLKQIITQKWVSLFLTGMESWFDYRRTGYPVLHVGEGHKNEGQLPVRYPYPSLVKSLNKTNYEDAISNIGGDGINIQGWWEKD